MPLGKRDEAEVADDHLRQARAQGRGLVEPDVESEALAPRSGNEVPGGPGAHLEPDLSS